MPLVEVFQISTDGLHDPRKRLLRAGHFSTTHSVESNRSKKYQKTDRFHSLTEPIFVGNIPIMLRFILFIFLLSASAALSAQIFTLEAEQNNTLYWEGNLSSGQPISDLSWAWNSSVACFVEPREEFFRGNHVLYRSELPNYSTMIITLVPDDPKQDISLYAYSGGHGATPPNLSSCVSCEADFPMDQEVRGRVRPAHVRSVELRAVRNPYPVTIGVSGPNGSVEGGYKLYIELKKNR